MVSLITGGDVPSRTNVRQVGDVVGTDLPEAVIDWCRFVRRTLRGPLLAGEVVDVALDKLNLFALFEVEARLFVR